MAFYNKYLKYLNGGSIYDSDDAETDTDDDETTNFIIPYSTDISQLINKLPLININNNKKELRHFSFELYFKDDGQTILNLSDIKLQAILRQNLNLLSNEFFANIIGIKINKINTQNFNNLKDQHLYDNYTFKNIISNMYQNFNNPTQNITIILASTTNDKQLFELDNNNLFYKKVFNFSHSSMKLFNKIKQNKNINTHYNVNNEGGYPYQWFISKNGVNNKKINNDDITDSNYLTNWLKSNTYIIYIYSILFNNDMDQRSNAFDDFITFSLINFITELILNRNTPEYNRLVPC